MHKYLILAGFLAATTIACHADSLITLVPGEDLSGPPGSTLIWELDVSNTDPSLYLQLLDPSASSFDGTQGYDDGFANYTYPAISPNTPEEIVPFYSLTWYPTATVGYGFSGDFTITAAYCTDSLGDGCGDSFNINIDGDGGAYSASVSESEVPEPGTLVLLGIGLLGICYKATNRC